MIYSTQTYDLNQMIARLTRENQIAAIKYIQYLDREQNVQKKSALNQIQQLLAGDRTWQSESEMIADLAAFRRDRMTE
ncbi:hypothetical protein IJJ08_01815 [bacterium]|nr:hypothetical protein [bacterium]